MFYRNHCTDVHVLINSQHKVDPSVRFQDLPFDPAETSPTLQRPEGSLNY